MSAKNCVIVFSLYHNLALMTGHPGCGVCNSGSYDVIFFDGLRKTLKPSKVQAISRTVQRKVCLFILI
jgi:hypothetical protein